MGHNLQIGDTFTRSNQSKLLALRNLPQLPNDLLNLIADFFQFRQYLIGIFRRFNEQLNQTFHMTHGLHDNMMDAEQKLIDPVLIFNSCNSTKHPDNINLSSIRR